MSKATTAERAKNRKPGTFSRLIKTLFSFYPVLLPLVTLGVIACAVINAIGPTFLQRALEIISTSWQSGDWEAARPQILNLVVTLGCIYAVGVLSALFWNRAMAVVTQGSLRSCAKKCSTACRTCQSATSIRTSAATSCRTTPTISTRCVR